MKVLLIHLPYYRGQKWSLPLGLAYIAAVLLEAGVDVKILDINLLTVKKRYSPEILKKILESEKFIFIGFGAVFFDFTFFQKLSSDIKNICPNTPQIIGGQWASRIPELLTDNTSVDAVVLGEGEEIVLQIVDCLHNEKPIDQLQYVHVKNKAFVNEFAVVKDLNKIPFPARHLFDMNSQRKEMWVNDPMLPFATVLATRGCVYNCVFCKPLGGKSMRSRRPDNIIKELLELNKKYGIKYFRFNDEVFLGTNKKVIEFCDALEKSGLKIVFAIWSWSAALSEAAIKRLKDVGCNLIQVGIESGSPTILKEMNKIQNLQSAKKQIELLSENGISCGSGFLTGTPGETIETLRETKEYLKELNLIRNFSLPRIHTIKFFSGTPLYNTAKQKGFIRSDLEIVKESDKNQMYIFINLTNINVDEYMKELKKINNELKRDYYLKHKSRIVKRILNATLIDYRNLFKLMSFKDAGVIISKFITVLREELSSIGLKIRTLKL
jgi:radical SAM superfamily enzyme YgiQ (UPF0313 family)